MLLGSSRQFSRAAAQMGITFALLAAPALLSATPPTNRITLSGHVPVYAIAHSHFVARVAAAEQISLAITLPLQHRQQLDDLLTRLYDPTDALYGQYLTPEEFAERFSPTREQYQAVIAYAESQGLTVTNTHSNRLILDVAGPAHAVEQAFAVKLARYRDSQGQIFHAPTTEPQIPAHLEGTVSGIVGLEDAEHWHTHALPQSHAIQPPIQGPGRFKPLQIGTGPNSGLSPSDIKNAYNLNGNTTPGKGQTLGLFELDGFVSTDITTYESYFGITTPPKITTKLVAGARGRAGSGAGEVTLDIELQIALAPSATAIYVYEGPNSNTGVVDTYNQIATDNIAKEISTSWGLAELSNSTSVRSSENSAFAQMQAQGQSIFAAAGDSGAYDNGSTLSVDDPGSQPNMVSVGGTELFVNTGETYNHETTWNVNGTISGGAGGGGISAIWTIPSWQVGVIGSGSKGSTTYRNVPDVSLNADQYTGYAIYQKAAGGWTIYGGTSCAAPLWAAFTAIVNQDRVANGKALLGFADPAIYSIAKGANYSLDFHDVTTGTNLYYPAVTGFDDATGWGSFNGNNLLKDLTNY